MSSSTLEKYRQAITELKPLDDAGFRADLEKCRAGDDEARRRILGSALCWGLEAAEARRSHLPLLELIQEANAALEHALATFAGQQLGAFRQHAAASIDAHLDGFVRLADAR